MKQRLNSYKAYSLGCAIVWAAILLAVRLLKGPARLQIYGAACIGWWSGWLSATIARSYYPR